MGFAAGPVAGMALVQVGFVDHRDAFGSESFAQLVRDNVFHRHDPRNIVTYQRPSMAPRTVLTRVKT
jgi:hypothetical protein